MRDAQCLTVDPCLLAVNPVPARKLQLCGYMLEFNKLWPALVPSRRRYLTYWSSELIGEIKEAAGEFNPESWRIWMVVLGWVVYLFLTFELFSAGKAWNCGLEEEEIDESNWREKMLCDLNRGVMMTGLPVLDIWVIFGEKGLNLWFDRVTLSSESIEEKKDVSAEFNQESCMIWMVVLRWLVYLF